MTTNINASKDTLAGQVINLRRGVDLPVCYSRGRHPAVVFLHGGMGNRFNTSGDGGVFRCGQLCDRQFD